VSKSPKFIAGLLRRGVTDEDVAKIAEGNLLRVWCEVDQLLLNDSPEDTILRKIGDLETL
jgi:membrane dipeptidase